MGNSCSCCAGSVATEDNARETRSTQTERSPVIKPIRTRQQSEPAMQHFRTTEENRLLYQIICEKTNQIAVGRSFSNLATSSARERYVEGSSCIDSRDAKVRTRDGLINQNFSRSYIDPSYGVTRAVRNPTTHNVQRSNSSGQILDCKKGYIPMDKMKPLGPRTKYQFHRDLATLCPDADDDTTTDEEDEPEPDREVFNVRKKRQVAKSSKSACGLSVPLSMELLDVSDSGSPSFLRSGSPDDFSRHSGSSTRVVDYTDMQQARLDMNSSPVVTTQTGYINMNKVKKITQPSALALQKFQEDFAKWCPEAADDDTDSETSSPLHSSNVTLPYMRDTDL